MRGEASSAYDDDTDCDVGAPESAKPHGADAKVGRGGRLVVRPARLSSPDLAPPPASHAPRRVAAPPRPGGKKARDEGAGPHAAATPRVPTVTHGARGAALRWTAEEDAALAKAVSENRKAPDKRSLNGIQWAAIQRRAATDYPLLMRHLTSARGSKTCAKRWCQYLCPDDQANKNRKWR